MVSLALALALARKHTDATGQGDPGADELIQLAEGAEQASSADRIAEALYAAIIQHRLAPGTQLKERTLGEIFGASRTLVREALIRLSQARLVNVESNRGAFVAVPTAEEAREVFAARRMLESQLLYDWIPNATTQQVDRLHAHVQAEQQAVGSADAARRTYLLGDFHVELARITGNSVVTEITQNLSARSSLILLVYQSLGSAATSHDEHGEIVQAIEQRDVERAVALAREHIHHVERSLRLDSLRPLTDLRAAINSATAGFEAKRRERASQPGEGWE